MPDNVTPPSEITFRYIVPDHVQDNIITGVYGGVTPRGMLSAIFFHESFPIPEQETCKIVNGIPLPPEIDKRVISGDLTRKVQASIVMDVSTAVMLKTWLEQRIGELENMADRMKTDHK